MGNVMAYIELSKDYEKLKKKYLAQGKKNNELHQLNQALVSENTILKELVCEKLEIKPDVLAANIKMYQQEKRARDASIRVKEFIKMSKEYAKNNYKQNVR